MISFLTILCCLLWSWPHWIIQVSATILLWFPLYWALTVCSWWQRWSRRAGHCWPHSATPSWTSSRVTRRGTWCSASCSRGTWPRRWTPWPPVCMRRWWPGHPAPRAGAVPSTPPGGLVTWDNVTFVTSDWHCQGVYLVVRTQGELCILWLRWGGWEGSRYRVNFSESIKEY